MKLRKGVQIVTKSNGVRHIRNGCEDDLEHAWDVPPASAVKDSQGRFVCPFCSAIAAGITPPESL